MRVRLNDTRAFLVDAQTLKLLKDCHETNDQNDFGTMTDDMQLNSRDETPFPNTTYGLETEVFCHKGQRLSQFGDIDFDPLVVDDSRFLAIAARTLALRKLTGETVWTRFAPPGRVLKEAAEEQQLSRDRTRVAVRVQREVVYYYPVRLEGKSPAATLLRPVQFNRDDTPRSKTIAATPTSAN